MEGKFLYKDLSYRVIGLCMEIHNEYGHSHRENIYHNSLAEKLEINKIPFKSKQKINIYPKDTGNKLGFYEPDYIIDDKIVLELKAMPFESKQFEIQLSEYIEVSEYEIGYLINFGLPSLYFKRLICTNDKKDFIAKKSV